MRELSEWDRFKEVDTVCEKICCKQLDLEVCRPELIKKLCLPKKELLRKLGVEEEELKDNRVKVKDILRRLEAREKNE